MTILAIILLTIYQNFSINCQKIIITVFSQIENKKLLLTVPPLAIKNNYLVTIFSKNFITSGSNFKIVTGKIITDRLQQNKF